MTCPTCSFENRPDARFCGECGGALAAEVRCAGCGRTNPAGRRFCDECGRPLGALPAERQRPYTPRHLADKILRARSALEGERKQVTVLFADVKGSMELAEQVDAEEWHRILDRFFQILTEGVHRYEGTVNQYTGDGIMALFGAPIAHEDHAQRACFAALDLRDALRRYADELRVSDGLNFSVRMGLNSGDVVVGRIGDDLRMDYTAQGATVGLAARMESLAEPGKVLLSPHTAELVSGFFRLRDLGAARVRGASEPLRLYELEGVGEMRTRFDLSRARGFSRFVGREAEMAELEQALERALAGEAAAIGITAEAGTGKSRLCHELAQRCRARGIAVYEGHALSHGRMVPLLPLLEMLRGLFGVGAGDDPATARQKIAGTIVLLDPELQERMPLWFDFLGVPDAQHPLPALSPEARQARLVGATRRLLQARGRSGPNLLLFEDLHWLDPASEALLASLAEGLAGSRTLLLVNFRPEYQSTWKHRDTVPYREIQLQPLGDADIEALLDDLLGGDANLGALRRRLRESAAGSPFFVEEAVRSLFEHGALERRADGGVALLHEVEQIEIPATVQAVLAARIDRLAEAPKLVLQTAAVIGKAFPEPVLRAALSVEEAAVPLDAALDELEAGGFLRRTALHPEVRWAFLHPLTQEVAYGSQLGDRRARVHAAVAHAIEAAYADRLDEQAGLLAQHWAGAGEPLRAAEWHARAAEWLGARDRRAMMRHWQQVRELVGRTPESPEALALGAVARQRLLVNGVFVGMSPDEVARLFYEGLELAERLPNPAPRLLLGVSYGLTRMFAGAVGDALEQMREVLQLAEESEQPLLRYVARVSMLAPLIHSGHLLEAVARAEEAERLSGGDVTLGADFTRFSPYGALLANKGQALLYLGRVDEVPAPLARAEEIGRSRNDPELVSMARVFRAQLHDLLGDGEGAMRFARQAVEAAESSDSPQLRVGAYGALGGAHALAGEWQEAIQAWSLVLRTMRETGTGLFLEAQRLGNLAEARLQAGDRSGARRDAEQAVALARERQALTGLARVLVARAAVLRHEGEVEAAAADLSEAEELIAYTAARAFEPLAQLERAALAELRGDPGARRRALAAARAIWAEMRATARVAAVDVLLGR